MTRLNINEIMILNELINKLKHGTANLNDIRDILKLIRKSGKENAYELQTYARTAGYPTIKALEKHLSDIDTEEFLDGLVKIGLAVLIAYGIKKLLEER